jgi:hypothetical protein
MLLLSWAAFGQTKSGSGFLPSLDKQFTFSQTGNYYYLISLTDSTKCHSYLNFDPDTIPQDYELYQYTVDEKREEIEFTLYDRRVIEQQAADSGRIYDKPKALTRKECFLYR